MRFNGCTCCGTGVGPDPGTCDYVSHCAPLLSQKFRLTFPLAAWVGGCTAPGVSGCTDCSNLDGDPTDGFILEWEGPHSEMGPCAWSCLAVPWGETNNCPQITCPDREPDVQSELYFLLLMGDGNWYLGISLTDKWYWTVDDASFNCGTVTGMNSGELVTEPCTGCDVFGGVNANIEPYSG
jgi:hypothetical protein